MISEQAFKKTEGMLYRYYKNIRKKDRMQHKRYSLENRIDQIRRDIKETNVELDDGMGAIDYSKDRVQSSPTGAGPGEQSLMREITKLENELKVTIKGKLKLQAKIRELEAEISDTEYVINQLSEEYKQLIELKYGSSFKMSNVAIGIQLNMTEATVRRKRVEVVEAIAKWMNVA
jgi:hypothetical protein